jgi:hypothetical protein
MPKIPIAQKEEMTRLYLAGYTMEEAGKAVGHDKYACYRAMKALGVKARDASTVQQLHPLNCDFFDEIKTEEQAYWLGFIAADGNVCGNLFQIDLAVADRPHLVKLKVAIGSGHPIVDRLNRRTNTIQSRFAVSNQRLVSGLHKSGIHPRKTADFTPPSLLPELQRHFWRGMVDGDGSVYESKGKWYVSLTGTKNTCEVFAAWVKSFVNTKTSVLPGNGVVWQITFSGVSLPQKIAQALYGDCTVALERKLERYRQLMKATHKQRDWSHLDKETILAMKGESDKGWKSRAARSLGMHPSQFSRLCRARGVL